MDIKTDNSLSEILIRSKRLEQVLPFRTQLTVPTILQRSREISRSNVDNRVGYLLLAQQHVNIENAKEILNTITNPRVISDNYLSFKDRSYFSYQQVIINSISEVQKSTEKLDDELIYRAFQERQRQTTEKADQPISVPIHNLDPVRFRIYGDSLRMELVEKSKFYCSLLPQFDKDMPRVISEAILSSRDKLNNYESQYFADTFSLIYFIDKYSDGASAFLELQKKHLIVNETNSNLRYLNRGGEIGIIRTIETYLENKGNKSPYAVIFYAIRCGEKRAASEYADTGLIDANVKTALQQYSRNIPLMGNLKDTLIKYLNSEFQSPQYDLFKILTLTIVTKTRRKIKSEKTIKIEDWIWYELQFTKDLGSIYQQLIQENLIDRPELRGQILLIVGFYDDAANWFLDQMKVNLQDNLHIIICLHVLGFINSDILLEPLLNYSIEIFKTDKEAAIRYLCLIREHDKSMDSIANLIIKADKGYQALENAFQSDKGDSDSPISKVLTPENVDEVIGKASAKAREMDLYDLAIKLYRLRNDFMGILSYDIIKLTQIIKNFSNNQVLNKINQHFALIQEEQADKDQFNPIHETSVDPLSLRIMRDLYRLATACEFVRVRDFDNAVSEFEDSDLFPPIGVSQETQDQIYSNLPEIIKDIMPFVIIPALTAYYNKYLLTESDGNSSNREKLREKAEAIRQYATCMNLNSQTQATILNLSNSI